MDAPRRYRTQVFLDVGGPSAELIAPDPLDEAVPLDALLSDWRCDWCNQLMSAEEFACGYCGEVRDDDPCL